MVCAEAYDFPSRSVMRKTANPFGSAGARTTALSGTTSRGLESRVRPRIRDPIMPGLTSSRELSNCHFDRENAALRIGLRGNRRDHSRNGVLQWRPASRAASAPGECVDSVVSGTAKTALTRCVSTMLKPTVAPPTRLPRSTFRAEIQPANGARRVVSPSESLASFTAACALATPSLASSPCHARFGGGYGRGALFIVCLRLVVLWFHQARRLEQITRRA